MSSVNASKVAATIHKAHKLHQQGKFDKAEINYRKVLKSEPDNFDALQGLGAIALQNKIYPQAIKLLESALSLQPTAPGLLCNLGLAYKYTGDKNKARDYFRRTVEIDNKFGPAYYNLALLHIDNGEFEQALMALQEAERCRPGHVPTLSDMARTLARIGRFDEAINYFRHALQLNADDAQLQFELGTTYQSNQHYQEAIEAFRKATACDPNFYDAQAKLADALESVHRSDEAQIEVKKLISTSPDHPLGNLILARIERRNGELVKAKQRLQQQSRNIEHSNTSTNDDISAGIFTELGTTLDRLNEYDDAFHAFEKANQIMTGLPSTQQLDSTQAFNIIGDYRTWLDQRDKGSEPTQISIDDSYPSPVFLVGFPRSGTTLTEQILAVHDKVTTSDELPVLHQMATSLSNILQRDVTYPAGLDSLNNNDVHKLRQYYWNEMTTALGDKILNGDFVDKMPLNIIHLGLIERIFPQARVIVALRDPRDVCLSCFMQLFHINESMLQFLNISNTAKYYAAVMGLWLEYRDKLNLHWIESRYEDIVSDFDQSANRLNAFLGLDKNQSMSNFHQRAANRAISTPSYQDVSTPIYQRAMGRWQHYDQHLETISKELLPYVKAFGYVP